MDENTTPSYAQPEPESSLESKSGDLEVDKLMVIKLSVKDVVMDPQRVIASIHSQRIPVALYIAIAIGQFEYKTANMPISQNGTDVEWEEQIVFPSDPPSQIFVKIYALFEVGPMLGVGELLYTVEVTTAEFLDRDKESLSFPVSLEGCNDILSCSSLIVVTGYCDATKSLLPSLRGPCNSELSGLPSDPHGLSQMTDSGHDALLRYRKNQRNQDLVDAVREFETALKLCPIDHPCRAVAVSNLAVVFAIGYQFDSRYTTLDGAVSLHREALTLRSQDNPDRINTLFHLAMALLSRRKMQSLIADTKEAEDILSIILESSPTGSFHHQATKLLVEAGKSPIDLAKAADPGVGSSDRSWLLDTLDGALTQCVKGNLERLNEVISGYYNAMISRTPSQLQYPRIIGSLGLALKIRFDRDESVSLAPYRARTLNNLCGILLVRFKRQGDKQDLDNAILHSRSALMLEPSDPTISLNLATALSNRFEDHGDQKDLDDSIFHGFKILLSSPFLPPSMIPFAIQHADRLRIRHKYRSDSKDLQISIQIIRSVLAHPLVNHSNRSSALVILATALYARFKGYGDQQNLHVAISCGQEALKLLPVDHPLRSDTLYSLAEMYRARFELRSDVQDLSEAILLYLEDLSLYPEKISRVCGLAKAQLDRFLQLGDKQDLDDAILQLRKCLTGVPDGDETKKELMSNLAQALVRRFDNWNADLQTIDEAIQLYRRSLALHSADDPNYPGCLNNLAATLNSRFRRRREKETLEEIIQLYRQSLASYKVDSPSKAKTLTNLGNVLEHQDNMQALDEALSLHKEALKLQPDGDPFRPIILCHLTKAYLRRYRQSQNKQDLDHADQYSRGALELFRADAVDRTSALLHLAEIACMYFEHARRQTTGDNCDPRQYMDAAMQYFKDAAELRSSGPMWCLKASCQWVFHAEEYHHGSALAAYSRCIQVLDTHLSATASISSRHDFVKHFPPNIILDAASCALRQRNVYRAVELLEQGRTLIWTQMSRYRTPIDELFQLDERSEEQAAKFQRLSTLLNNPRGTDEPGMFPEENAKRYERIVEDWNHTVEEIREIDHFSRFLLPPLFSDLQEAACDGPVIILNASTYSCDAIIILHRQSPLHVQLPADFAQLRELAKSVGENVRRTRYDAQGERKLREILQQLWDIVVSPVVAELEKVVKRRSRIWWCPTYVLTLLPLHTAGEYLRPKGRHLSQLYTSSYTPSLSTLIKARARNGQVMTKRFAAIGQAQPFGYRLPLKSVEQELELVGNLVPKTASAFSKLTSTTSTRDTTLRTLEENEWIHFSCHGVQRLDEPYNSCFLMRDEPLTLLDITSTDLKTHEFAFLSACETAVGDEHALDEVIHLAAALQFAGVKSVIGTMWEVDDATAVHLVEAFYKNMFADGKMDCMRAAGSLHKALRSDAAREMTLAQRIVFIHIGI